VRARSDSGSDPGPSDLGVVEGILADRAFLDDRRNSASRSRPWRISPRTASTPAHRAEHPRRVGPGRSLGVEPAAIATALDGFRLDAHRIEVVARAGGITWVDDSKATNPHAAQSSLQAFPGAIWIVGGDLKGVDLSSSSPGGRDRPRGRRDRRRPGTCSRRSHDTRPRCRSWRSSPATLKRS
jgi:UDP-N-acetylmuramoylalanine--D-glutamate ligase